MSRLVLKLTLTICLGIFGAAACGDDDAGDNFQDDSEDDGATDGTEDDGDDGEDDGGDDGATCTHLGCFTEQQGTWHLFGPTPADNPLDGSTGTLRRYETYMEGADNSLTGLEPGHVYTFWWVFFNAPENCVGTPNDVGDPVCFTDDLGNPVEIGMSLVYGIPAPTAGLVADDAGAFTYKETFRYDQGDNEGALEAPFDAGLSASTWDAEVHFIVRDHGPALEGKELDAQLTNYCGGCNNEAEGFCPEGKGPNSCREVAYVRYAPVEEPEP
jgi:hypothetical protein